MIRLISTHPVRPLLAVILALSTGCASKASIRVDDGLLVQLSHEQMEGVRQARVDRDTARDALAAAGLAEQRASDQLAIAKKEREVVRAELKVAALRMKFAKDRGTQQELDAARALQSYGEACLARATQQIELCKLDRVQTDRSRDLAEERVGLRAAEVVLAKARALGSLDSVAVAGLSVEEADEAVRKHYQRVQELQTKAQDAAAGARDARQRYTALERAAEAIRPQTD